MEAFVRPGMDLRNWVPGPTRRPRRRPDRAEGDVALRRAPQGQPSHYIERLALRLDGFASVRASYAGGEMLTRPLRFRGGGS